MSPVKLQNRFKALEAIEEEPQEPQQEVQGEHEAEEPGERPRRRKPFGRSPQQLLKAFVRKMKARARKEQQRRRRKQDTAKRSCTAMLVEGWRRKRVAH